MRIALLVVVAWLAGLFVAPAAATAPESWTGTHINGTNQVPYPDGETAGDVLVITAIAWATGQGTPGGSAMPAWWDARWC